MKEILQRRYSPRKGQGRAEPLSIGEGHGRGGESGNSLEELLGVWGTECCESRRRNKGDLVRSVAHIHRHSWYKPHGEV